MATNLYETLGINRNATTEEIRRAYRRKALETHPDRLPHGASAAEKSASEDMFRKVNNAYEVLQDPQNRAAYDQHGVWPVPQGPPANGPYDPFSESSFREPLFREPFSRGPRMEPFGGFGFGARPNPRGFTDPFVLFNSIFGDFQRAFESDPFFDDPFGRRGLGSSHFGSGFFSNAFPPMLSSPFDFGGGGMGSSRMQTFGSGSNGSWVSQSWTSSTVNGVTHSKSVRWDSEGNEHATYRYPDGTERRTINGVEQTTSQSQRALPPSAPPALPASGSSHTEGQPPPPTYHEAVAQPHRSRSSRHHGHYYDNSGDRREDRHGHGYGHKYHEGEREYAHDAHIGSPWKFRRS